MGLLPVLLLIVIGVYNVDGVIMYNDFAVPAAVQKAIAMGVEDVRRKNQFEEEIFLNGVDNRGGGIRFMTNQGGAGSSPFGGGRMGGMLADFHSKFQFRTRGRRRENNRQRVERSEITIRATLHLSRLLKAPIGTLMTNIKIVNEFAKQMTPICQYRPPICNPKAPYRTADGTCNNLVFTEWGRSNRGQKRLLPPAYLDGSGEPRTLSVTGKPLPSPRVVTNVVHNTFHSDIRSPFLTAMTMSYGQFIDHDLHLTPMTKGINGSDVQCCDIQPEIMAKRPACFPIFIPVGDPHFKKRRCMDLVRSVPAAPATCTPSHRDQTNEETSYMDGSHVYGSTLDEQRNLRVGKGGLLRMGPFGMMPPHPMDICIKEEPGDFCFDAGDDRSTEVPSLATNHVTFVREHNRIAKVLGKINPHWNDERIFQETRKIVAAQLQHITYNEYLPKLLSPLHMKTYGIYSSEDVFHTCYNPKIDPTVSNVFGVAAFRHGHSQIPDVQSFTDKSFHVQTDVPVEFSFNRPKFLLTNKGSGIDGVARWLASDPQNHDDRFIQEGVRSLLFLDVNNGNSFDLPALNIQRGRDHGIPSYNAWRKFCGLKPAVHFTPGVPGGLLDHTPEAAKLLASVYKHPDDIDLFPGGLSETKVPGGSTGPTFSCIIAKEFHRVKYGDRFWYENKFPTGFTAPQLKSIKVSSRLSRVTCMNTDMPLVQPDILVLPNPKNPRIHCKELPDLDFQFWREIPTAPVLAAMKSPMMGVLSPGFMAW